MKILKKKSGTLMSLTKVSSSCNELTGNTTNTYKMFTVTAWLIT